MLNSKIVSKLYSPLITLLLLAIMAPYAFPQTSTEALPNLSEQEITTGLSSRLASLSAFLELAPEQMAAWDQFSLALRKALTAIPVDSVPPVGLDQRMALREATLLAQAKQVREVREAFSRLWPTLTEAQRKKLDSITGP
jgi:hypothetical protein